MGAFRSVSGLLICAVVMGAPPDRIDNWSTRRDTFPMRARPSYQHEPFHLREAIWSRGYMTALQMLRIAAWKSARGLASLTLNDEDLIRLRTADAFDAIRPWRAADVLNAPVDWDAWREMVAHAVGSKQGQTGLLALEGVGYPMASAFLALLAPAAFPVIDRWAVHGVYGPTIGNYQTSLVYTDFAQALAARRGCFATANTIHELDQAVMTAAMNCSHDLRPCDCLPFVPADFPERG